MEPNPSPAPGHELLLARQSLERIHAGLLHACEQSGREPGEITLVGASKTVEAVRLGCYAEAGLRVAGENYVQEAVAKRAALPGSGLKWHLIGSLQRNKAREAVTFDLLHGVDRETLARALDAAAREVGKVQPVLVQVNLAGEANKSGCAPADLPALARVIAALPNLRLSGLMCLPPYQSDPEASRPYFQQLRTLRDEMAGEFPDCHELSMGMSNNFEVAITEGATLIRVGTALFGGRGD